MRWLVLSLLVLVAVAAWFSSERPPAPTSASVSQALGLAGTQGFATVQPGTKLQFPQDYGPHRQFKSEWWYVTGNLEEYGYQFTIFRQSLASPLQALPLPRQSAWATTGAYMGHLAVSDLHNRKFRHWERFSREAMNLAGATTRPFRVWLDGWSLAREGADLHLQARQDDVRLDLHLHPGKAEVLEGLDGYSQKGPNPAEASYYFSLPRLESSGNLTLATHQVPVHGSSWFDREWSTASLPQGVQGWDWFSLQFDDNQELMYYRLRTPDGKATAQSAGTWIDAAGRSTHLDSQEVVLEATRWWTSPDSTRYPVAWRLTIPSRQIDITVEPRLDDQEWTDSFRYWEGAVRCARTPGAVEGRGYLELVGYGPSPAPSGAP